MKRILFFLLLTLQAFGQGAPRRCDTLTDLLSIDPRAVSTAGKLSYDVSGRTTLGDWGAPRTADWVPGSAAATNDFIFPTVAGGRWIFRDYRDRTIDARIFGVVPHYATSRQDNSGTDNTVAIQRALDYLSDLGGGILEFPAASYKMGAVYVPPIVWIEGAVGGMYNQAYQTNAIGLSGITRFYPPGGFAGDMFTFRGSDGAALAPAQTTFTSGDLSKITNYMHGGGLRNIAIDTGYSGTRGREIFIDSCFGVNLENVGHYPYGTLVGLYVWGSNLIKVKNYVGLQRFPLYWIYSADNRMHDIDVGGTSGSVLWIQGAKNNIGDSTFFNAQVQPNTVRPTFTADSSTDVITISDSNVGKQWFTELPMTIEAAAGATLPGGLATNTTFYLIRVNDVQFKLNTQRDINGSGVGGAKQSVAMDITSNGSGTFTIGPGPVANAYVAQYDQNQFTNVRFDQSYGESLILNSAHNNAFVNCYFTESGWASSTSSNGAILLQGTSHNNMFLGSSVRNRDTTSHAAYGLISDGGGTNNVWIGDITGVTNQFGANPNSWTAQRWDLSAKEQNVMYSGAWRHQQSLPAGMRFPNYEDYGGVLTMFAPNNGTYAADFGATNHSETIKLTATSTNATQGPIESRYRYGGTAGAPAQVGANQVIGGFNDNAYNGSAMQFSLASMLEWTESAVTSTNAPTRMYWYTTATNSTTRLPRAGLLSNGTLLVTPEGISGFPAYPSVGIALDSTVSAFLPSRLTTAQRNALTPVNGMHIYNTDLSAPQYYNGSWVSYGTGTSSLTLEQVQDDMSTFLVAGTGISLSYNDGGNTLTIANTSPGTSISVNATNVTTPNFQNTSSVTWNISGSNITAVANGATNAARVYVDSAAVNDPNFADSSEINFTATGTNVSAALLSGSVNYSKIQNVTASRLLGRGSSGAGAPEELSLSGASISGTTLTVSPQKSTNIFLNGSEIVGVNVIDSPTVTWSAAGTNVTAAAKLTDGDKGDITVGSSGTTLTVDNNAVTYAKMQSASANKLLGRRNGTSGNLEEITIGTGLSMSSGGTLSATPASGIAMTVLGRAKFYCRSTPDYNIQDITVSGTLSSSIVYNQGDSDDSTMVTIPFTSAAPNTDYVVIITFEDAQNPGSPDFQRDQYVGKVRTTTKTTAQFQLVLSPSSYFAGLPGVWVNAIVVSF